MRTAFIAVLLACVVPVSAQVRIHDPLVRLLAKPYGIEERIRLESVDDLDFGPGGSARLKLRLVNSGVKQVTLERPDFEFEVAGRDGGWVGLGRLRLPEILFPVTAEDRTVSRCYVVDFTPSVGSAEVVKLLRSAAAERRAFRLIGRAGMRVKQGDDKDFHRKGLKLELGGRMVLAKGFSPRWHRTEKALPEPGFRN